MNVTVLIATYGDQHWAELAATRARPSARAATPQPAQTLLHHNPDATIAQTRNEAAERATSEWLCFLDADDELDPGYFHAMARVLGQQRDGGPWLLMPSVVYIHNGRPGRPLLRPVGDLRQDNFMVIGTLIQRHLFHQVGGFSDYPHGFEDWSLWAKAWKAGATVVPVRRAVYKAHVNPQSKHRQGWRDRNWQVATHNQVRAELFPELA